MSNSAKPLILCVDDSEDIRKLTERFLTTSGYDVIAADRGAKAFIHLDKVKPDLILLDVIMPEMDGYEFCAKLREKKEFDSIPVVFLTALKSDEDKAKAFALGAVDYLTKPITDEILIPAVKKHLATKKQWDELHDDVSVSRNIRKTRPDFARFKEYLVSRLNMPAGKRDELSGINYPQLFSAVGITNGQLAKLSAEFLGLTYVPFIDPENIQLGILPVSFCKTNSVIGIDDNPKKYTFVISNPFDWELMNTLRGYSKSDREVEFIITEHENIQLLFKYSSTSSTKSPIVEDGVIIVRAESKEKKKDVDNISEWQVERHPVAFIANSIILRALSERASDIHIEPKETNTVVRFRIDGDMNDIFTLQKKSAVMLISRYKVLAGLDIAERRKPQDGAFEAIISDRGLKLRLATTSTPYGESLVMRLLEPTAKPKALQDLGMTEEQVNTMADFATRRQGFVMIVGTTGSGKTTTIYSMLSTIDCKKRSLISVEDPVEYKIPLANQQQVNDKAGITFEALLKSSVRQDPNILYIGEIRDTDSAKIAIDFASTGHLTITTMHTSNATSAIFRLERLGINRWIMADTVLGVVAQRLLKKLCPACKSIVPISKEEVDMMASFTDEVQEQVAHPVGCIKCHNTGYLGREGVYEIIKFDQKVAEMVRSDTPILVIRDFIRKRGDFLMSDHAIEKVKNLIFSPRDAYEKVLVEDRKDEKKPEKETPQPDISDEKTGNKVSILVVEDDRDTQKLITRLLENEGYEVTVADDGIDALLHLGKKRFDLILSDINMPNLDGIKLLEMKNQKGIETPVIFLTAQTSEQDELNGFRLGAAGYLKKPLQKERLLTRIKIAIKR